MKGIYFYIVLVFIVLARNYHVSNACCLGVSANYSTEIIELLCISDFDFIDMDVDDDNDRFKYLGTLPSYNNANILEIFAYILFLYLFIFVFVNIINLYIDLPPPNNFI